MDRQHLRSLVTVWAGRALIATIVLVGTGLALLRHYTFPTDLLDLGYCTQVFWNTAHGRFFATTLKDPPTFLAGHFSPILVGLVYDPETLQDISPVDGYTLREFAP